mgnify:CR=1 FL=1
MVNVSVSTDELINAVGDRFVNTSPTYGVPSALRIGLEAQTPSAATSALTREAPITYTVVDACDATTGWSAGTDGSVALNSTDGEYIEGNGCLNLVKSGTTQTSVAFSKTTLSVDFTGKDLWVWIYITDLTNLATTACVTVRFGSDNSNYYSFAVDKADLVAGPNWIVFNSSTATSTTGTPAIAACDYTAIVIVTSATSGTYTGNSVRLDHIQVAGASDYTTSFYSGPTHTTATDVATSVVRVGIGSAVGQPLTNAAWYLSSGQVYGVDQHSEDTKTQEEEFEYTDGVQFVSLP